MTKILLVDDEKDYLDSMVRPLESVFDKVLCVDPDRPFESALDLWNKHTDLQIALVDVKMSAPEGHPLADAVFSGFQLVAELKAIRPDSRIGMLTGHPEHSFLAQAIECQADHFLDKLLSRAQLLGEVNLLKAWVTSAPALQALAESIAWRDPSTAGHSFRVRDYCLEIARVFQDADGSNFHLAACKVGAELHDLGKIEIPDDILLSADRLSDEQHQVMQRHVNAVRQLGRLLGPEFQSVGDWAYQHHRAYSKTPARGVTDYPGDDSLPRERDQPLVVRIMHVADVFDALLSDRSYRAGMPMGTALRIIQEDAKKGAFDESVVAALVEFSRSEIGRDRLGKIQRQGRIVDSEGECLDLFFGDRRLTPGRLKTLLGILSDLYLENGKAADVLSIKEIVIGDFSNMKAGATIRVRLGGKSKDLIEAARTLEIRIAETNWCRDQMRRDAGRIPDELRDLVSRNIRETPLHIALGGDT